MTSPDQGNVHVCKIVHYYSVGQTAWTLITPDAKAQTVLLHCNAAGLLKLQSSKTYISTTTPKAYMAKVLLKYAVVPRFIGGDVACAG